ncbi:MAG: hypothetical protein JST22_13295 [Bacteroidetes bacterium]|nr:hypothetical protein [Bacteroidota bacterium]
MASTYSRLLPVVIATMATIGTTSCGYYYTSTYRLVHPDRQANATRRSTGVTSAETVTIPCGPAARAVVSLDDNNSESPAIVLRIECARPCVVRSVEADLICSGERGADTAAYASDIALCEREDGGAGDTICRARSVAAMPEDFRTMAVPGERTCTYTLCSRRDVDAKYRRYEIRVRISLTVDGEPVVEVRNLLVGRERIRHWRMTGSC